MDRAAFERECPSDGTISYRARLALSPKEGTKFPWYRPGNRPRILVAGLVQFRSHALLRKPEPNLLHALKQRLLETVARSARLRILNELKRSQGLHAGELAERLKMSYMGVKELCDQMEKAGLLDTWRQPQARGRPFKLFRLTQRARDLYPTASNPLTLEVLEAAQKLFGGSSAEKLLLVVFQKTTADYETRVRGESTAERAKWLARLRDQDGYMTEFVEGEDGSLSIVEHHSPILDLLKAYPIVARMETELFQRILRVPVQREEDTVGGLYRSEFRFQAGA